MGEIISIKRSKDDDLLDQFQSVCPQVPAELDEAVRNTATRALGEYQTPKNKTSFKTVCVVVAAVSIIGVSIVRGVTTRWNNAVEAVAAYPQFAEPAMGAAHSAGSGSADSWRRTRSEWAAYIQHLESDPFYQHVLEEKRRFKQRYP